MNTIKLNNVEFEVQSYTKSTYLMDNTISSTANMQVICNDINILNNLMSEKITSIQITYDGTVIYTLNNIDAVIDSIIEYLNVDKMSITVNIRFNMDENIEE